MHVIERKKKKKRRLGQLTGKPRATIIQTGTNILPRGHNIMTRYYASWIYKGKAYSGFPSGTTMADVKERHEQMGLSSVKVREMTMAEHKAIYAGI